MSEPARRRAVAEDLVGLPKDRGFEILGGEIVEKATPSGEHGAAQSALSGLVWSAFGRRQGDGHPGGWRILTETEVALAPHDVIRPDLVGWRRERVPERPRGFPIRHRPDWVCEILSPSTASRDLGEKMRLLHHHGVPHHWIVDPEHCTLTVYRWTPDGYLLVTVAGPGDVARLDPFEAVELPVGAVFGEG